MAHELNTLSVFWVPHCVALCTCAWVFFPHWPRPMCSHSAQSRDIGMMSQKYNSCHSQTQPMWMRHKTIAQCHYTHNETTLIFYRFITFTVVVVAVWVRPKRSGPVGPGRTPTSSRQLSRRPWEPRREPCSRTSTQQLPPTTTTTQCRTEVGARLPSGRDGKKKKEDQLRTRIRIRCPSL